MNNHRSFSISDISSVPCSASPALSLASLSPLFSTKWLSWAQSKNTPFMFQLYLSNLSQVCLGFQELYARVGGQEDKTVDVRTEAGSAMDGSNDYEKLEIKNSQQIGLFSNILLLIQCFNFKNSTQLVMNILQQPKYHLSPE